MASNTQSNRSFAEWFSSLPACILLFLVVLFSTSSDIHNQILQIGEHYWPGYYKLRVDPAQPTCDPNINVEEQLQKRIEQNQEDDGLGLGLFDAAPIDPDLIRTSIENARLDCVNKVISYDDIMGRITPSVSAFRSVELFVSELIGVGLVSQKFILVVLVLLCAMTATMKRHHIAMRPILHSLDHYVSGIAQIAANSILLISSLAFQELAHSDGTKTAPKKLCYITSGFMVLACCLLSVSTTSSMHQKH
mgnify:CR=1 FL=1